MSVPIRCRVEVILKGIEYQTPSMGCLAYQTPGTVVLDKYQTLITGCLEYQTPRRVVLDKYQTPDIGCLEYQTL